VIEVNKKFSIFHLKLRPFNVIVSIVYYHFDSAFRMNKRSETPELNANKIEPN
jgi:hypothetical protein